MLEHPGKYFRLKRLLKDSRRVFIVAMDHGGEDAIYEGLENMPKLFEELFQARPNAFILNEGVYLRFYKNLTGKVEVILNIPFDPKAVEYAVKVDAVGVKTAYFGKYLPEASIAEKMRAVAREAYEYGVLYVNEVIPVDDSGKVVYDPRIIARIARVAAEYGGDIVKTAFAEPFEIVTRAVPAPVIIAGGEKGSVDIYQVVERAVKAGALGVAIGRNIFQSEKPGEVARRIREILDKGE